MAVLRRVSPFETKSDVRATPPSRRPEVRENHLVCIDREGAPVLRLLPTAFGEWPYPDGPNGGGLAAGW